MVSMIKEGTELMLSCVQGLPSVQGTTIRDVSDPTANQDEQLFCHHVFKFICIKLSKSPNVDLLAPRELELNLAEGLDHMLFVLQPGAVGHYHLANVDPGHCALGLSKGAAHICLESISSSTNNILLMRITWKGWNHSQM